MSPGLALSDWRGGSLSRPGHRVLLGRAHRVPAPRAGGSLEPGPAGVGVLRRLSALSRCWVIWVSCLGSGSKKLVHFHMPHMGVTAHRKPRGFGTTEVISALQEVVWHIIDPKLTAFRRGCAEIMRSNLPRVFLVNKLKTSQPSMDPTSEPHTLSCFGMSTPQLLGRPVHDWSATLAPERILTISRPKTLPAEDFWSCRYRQLFEPEPSTLWSLEKANDESSQCDTHPIIAQFTNNNNRPSSFQTKGVIPTVKNQTKLTVSSTRRIRQRLR